MGDRHPERFRCGPDNDWTMERQADGGVLFRRWHDGAEQERFVVPARHWVDGAAHVAHPDHATPTSSRVTIAQLEYIHLGPRS